MAKKALLSALPRLCLLVLSGLNSGCNADLDRNADVSVKPPVPPPASATQEENDPLSVGRLDDGPDSLKQAWIRFTKGGRYRAARPDDFKFPDGAATVIQSLESRLKDPYMFVGWDINGDGDSHDFAAIVVDTATSNQMAVVIFSGANGKPYKPYRVQSEYNPTVTILARASNMLFLETYFDGSRRSCQVKWGGRETGYYCQ